MTPLPTALPDSLTVLHRRLERGDQLDPDELAAVGRLLVSIGNRLAIGAAPIGLRAAVIARARAAVGAALAALEADRPDELAANGRPLAEAGVELLTLAHGDRPGALLLAELDL